MKVSTDSLLFGAWVRTQGVNSVADFGSGCGILALMLAQRTASLARIDAVEYEADAAQQAQENVTASPWPNKVRVWCADVLQFSPAHGHYDLVVMNPPYFAAHLASSNQQRQLARQGDGGKIWSTWLAQAERLLAPNGRIALVAPMTAYADIDSAINDFQDEQALVVIRRCDVRSVPNKPPYLVLLELARARHREFDAPSYAIETLTIRAENKYTDAFLHYTGAFYLDKARD